MTVKINLKHFYTNIDGLFISLCLDNNFFIHFIFIVCFIFTKVWDKSKMKKIIIKGIWKSFSDFLTFYVYKYVRKSENDQYLFS